MLSCGCRVDEDGPRTAVDEVVEQHGVNGLTWADLLAALDGIDDLTANGWMGAKDLKGNWPVSAALNGATVAGDT